MSSGRDSRRETDYLDLYLIHWPDPATPFAETMDVLEGLVRGGKARARSASNFTGEQVRQSVGAFVTTALVGAQ